MRLESLSLRGVLRFRDPVTLDARDLPSGLIAIVGENGAGKTSLMEAPIAALYRQFPSRGRELVDYATGGDAYIEVRFSLDGRGLFAARLNLDGLHRKAEATIAQVGPDGRPVFLNDGKVSTYDAAIKTLLPPLDDLLASVFAAQTRAGSFSALDPKGRRQLFASLLGLDRLERQAELARSAATRIDREIERSNAERHVIARECGADRAADLDHRAQQLQTEIGRVDVRRAELVRVLADLEAGLERSREAAEQFAAAKGRRAALEASKATLVARLADIASRVTAGQQAHREQFAAITADYDRFTARKAIERQASPLAKDLQAIEDTRARAVADAQRRIAGNEGLLGRAAAIRAAAALVPTLEAALFTRQADVAGYRQDLERQRAHQAAVRARVMELDKTAAALARAEQDAALLGDVPCGGTGAFAGCQFLTNAEAARQQIADLRQTLAPLHDVAADLEATTAVIDAVRATLAAAEEEIRTQTADLQEAKAIAADLAHLNVAEERIDVHRRTIADVEGRAVTETTAAHDRERARLDAIDRDLTQRADEHRRAIAVLDQRAAQADLDMRAETERVEAELAALKPQLVDVATVIDRVASTAAAAEEQRRKLAVYQAEREETTALLASIKARVEVLQRERAMLGEKRAQLNGIEARIEALRADLVDWLLLAKALGREGVQTLEIDAAGPAVTAFANDLLRVCYGGRFTVDLVTQEAKVNKGKDGSLFKEVFKLLVYDNQRSGAPVDLTDLSGGERVLVEECLRSAIALLVNTRNQQPWRTAWRDETTGALDPDHAIRYVSMLRRVQDIGGFERIYFVSHNQDCARLADAQVCVEKGALQIALPPFADMAQETAA